MKTERSIIIYGPRGSGKTTLALMIADMAGGGEHTLHVDVKQMLNPPPFFLSGLAEKEISTVIVECGDSGFKSWRDEVTQLIEGTELIVSVKARGDVTCLMPNFIFCVSNCRSLALARQDKRFMVMKVNGVTW